MIPIVRMAGQTALVAPSAALGAPAATAQSSDGSFANPFRFMQQDGEVIYRTVCQGCHMPEGQSAAGAGEYPALAKNPRLEASGYLAYIVVNGSKAMPPFARLLNDDQIV